MRRVHLGTISGAAAALYLGLLHFWLAPEENRSMRGGRLRTMVRGGVPRLVVIVFVTALAALGAGAAQAAPAAAIKQIEAQFIQRNRPL